MTLIDLGLLCLFPVIFILAKAFDRKKWVDLTEDEMVFLRSRVQEYTPLDSVKYGEAIQRATAQVLKEKNT
ncbi:hypothetical protein [Caudoviricetes sp.]|nr:hypothetical protein [Caudoviricetes sp.]